MLPPVAGGATVDGRRCCHLGAPVLPMNSDNATKGGRRCCHQWPMVLPMRGCSATKGGRQFYKEMTTVLLLVAGGASSEGGNATKGVVVLQGRKDDSAATRGRQCYHRRLVVLRARVDMLPDSGRRGLLRPSRDGTVVQWCSKERVWCCQSELTCY